MIYEPCVLVTPGKIRIDKSARVDSFCKIEGGDGVTIGPFVHIASFSHINVGGGCVVFEPHSGCSSHCCVGGASSDWNYLYASAAEPAILHRKRKYLTVICRYALLFMNVTVLPGRTVGEGAVVLPGSLVEEDVAPWAIVKGNPARQIGERTLYEYRSHLHVSQCDDLFGALLRPDDGLSASA